MSQLNKNNNKKVYFVKNYTAFTKSQTSVYKGKLRINTNKKS